MKTVYGVNNYHNNGQRLIIALGNFDGLHLAHQKIIKRTVTKAREKGFKSAVFLLDPHPLKVLCPQENVLMLSSLKEKAKILKDHGLDYLIIEQFNNIFSMISPYQFIRDYLAGHLKAAGIVVGFDYTFGRCGKGSPASLFKWGEKFNYEVEVVPPIKEGGAIISSSFIRDLVIKGELEKASRYLGYCFQRTGKVVYGEGRGKKLGYPTANLDIAADLLLPGNGVYLSLALWNDCKLFGLTNIGKKPTFCRSDRIFVELFLLDFEKDIYGEELTVIFLHKIREERFFTAAAALKKQIGADLAIARKLIAEQYLFLLD